MPLPSSDLNAAPGSSFSDKYANNAARSARDELVACTDQSDSAVSEAAVAAAAAEAQAWPAAPDPRVLLDVAAENKELRRNVITLEEKIHNLQSRLEEMQAQMEESEQSWSDEQQVWRSRFEAERARLHLELHERAQMIREDERGLLQREVVCQISRAMETLREQSEGLIGCSEHLEAENERLKQLLREHIAERKVWAQRSSGHRGAAVHVCDSSSQTPIPMVPTETENFVLEKARLAGVDVVVRELSTQGTGMLQQGLRTRSIRALESQAHKLDAAMQVALGADLQPKNSVSELHNVVLRLKGLSGQLGRSPSRCLS